MNILLFASEKTKMHLFDASEFRREEKSWIALSKEILKKKNATRNLN